MTIPSRDRAPSPSSEPRSLVATAALPGPRWITGARYDLLWYLLPCVTGYLAVWLHLGLAIPAVVLWWVYVVALDGPHIFATLSRTVFDRQERAARSGMFWRSLLLFVPGPLLVLAGIAGGSRTPFLVFLVFANMWAYWHVVRQHYGFLVLYQKKNGEPAGRASPVDYWAFYALMLLPFVSFLLRHPQARESIGLGPALTTMQGWMVDGLGVAITLAAVVYVAKELRIWLQGGAVNVPKNLFLLTCVPLHLMVLLHPVISTQSDLLMFAVYVTVFHNVQYHGIVWFYNRNRYGADADGERYGMASRISRNFVTYYTAGLLFTVLVRYSGWFLTGNGEIPLAPGANAVSTAALGPLFTFSDFAFALWWGFALNHYWLDQKIWRTSKDRKLNEGLRMA